MTKSSKVLERGHNYVVTITILNYNTVLLAVKEKKVAYSHFIFTYIVVI